MQGATMTRRELEAIARRWIVEGWQKEDARAVYAMYSPDFVDLSNPYAERGTRDDDVQGSRDLYTAFTDFHAEIDDLVIDTETGTQRGKFFGVPPTGRRVAFHGIETLRIAGGLIVERAGEWDGTEILRQITE